MNNAERAFGIAGYAVALELMSKLEERGILSRNDGAAIIDAALTGLERTAVDQSTEALALARKALDHQLKLWQQDRPEGS